MLKVANTHAAFLHYGTERDFILFFVCSCEFALFGDVAL